jgi:hypothetical protein
MMPSILVYGYQCGNYIVVQELPWRWSRHLLQNIGTYIASYITSYSKSLILYQHHCKNLKFCIWKIVSLIMFLSVAAVMGALSHMKPASSGNLDSTFPLKFNLPQFLEESQSSDLQHQSKPYTYVLTHDGALCLKY